MPCAHPQSALALPCCPLVAHCEEHELRRVARGEASRGLDGRIQSCTQSTCGVREAGGCVVENERTAGGRRRSLQAALRRPNAVSGPNSSARQVLAGGRVAGCGAGLEASPASAAFGGGPSPAAAPAAPATSAAIRKSASFILRSECEGAGRVPAPAQSGAATSVRPPAASCALLRPPNSARRQHCSAGKHGASVIGSLLRTRPPWVPCEPPLHTKYALLRLLRL